MFSVKHPNRSTDSLAITSAKPKDVQGTNSGEGTSSGVRQLSKNQGPLSPNLDSSIKKSQNPETERPESRHSMPGSWISVAESQRGEGYDQARQQHRQQHLESQVAVQKAHLQALHANEDEPKLNILTETFKLEGMTLAAHPELHGSLTNLYAHLNPTEAVEVPHPYAPDSFPGEKEAENIRDHSTATHSSYEKVINHLESQSPRDEAAISLVKNALTSFKAHIGQMENDLEEATLSALVNMEKTANQAALFPEARTQRTTATAEAKADLVKAQQDLATFKQASNHILVKEHREDNIRRSINFKENGVLNSLGVMMRGGVGAGLPQSISSFFHWGLGRTGMGQIAKDKFGRGAVFARGGIEGTSLGAFHDGISFGPRDAFHALTEMGGVFRLAEAISPEENFPSTPPVHVDDQGNVVRLTAEDLKSANEPIRQQQRAYFESLVDTEEHAAELQQVADAIGTGDVKAAFATLHKKYGERATNFSFGTPRGDWAGMGEGFAGMNAIRDLATLMGHINATDITPLDKMRNTAVKAGFSAAGGFVMSFEQERGKLANKFAGVPTHALAKRQNPRSVGERVWNGMQGLDYTNQANRVRLFGKMSSAAVGSTFGAMLDHGVSAPLEAIIKDETRPTHERVGAGALHVAVEGAKSIVTLQSFFGDIAAGAESKKLNTGSKDGKLPFKRLEAGFENLTSPGRPGAARANPEGSWTNTLVEKPHNVLKGATQIIHQTGVVAAEGVVQVGIAGAKGVGSAGMAGAKSVVGGLSWIGEKAGGLATSVVRGNRQRPPDEETELGDRPPQP